MADPDRLSDADLDYLSSIDDKEQYQRARRAIHQHRDDRHPVFGLYEPFEWVWKVLLVPAIIAFAIARLVSWLLASP